MSRPAGRGIDQVEIGDPATEDGVAVPTPILANIIEAQGTRMNGARLQVTGKCDGPAALGLDAAPDAVGSPEHVSHATALMQPRKGGHVPLPDQWDRGP